MYRYSIPKTAVKTSLKFATGLYSTLHRIKPVGKECIFQFICEQCGSDYIPSSGCCNTSQFQKISIGGRWKYVLI